MKRKTVLIMIISLFVSSVLILPNITQGDVAEFFSISLLSPNTDAARNQWTLLMENKLPEIGIGIDFHESTGWSNIAPRTWAYPLISYPYIPTYADGGFDILFVGWHCNLDWDPTGRFETAAIVPMGDNFYQYANPTYDATLLNYLTEMNQVLKTQYSHQLQAILYEDLPAISLVCPQSLFGFKEGLTGIDSFLLSEGLDRYEFWDDPDDHIIKYAIPVDFHEYNQFVLESFYAGQWMQGVYGSLYQRNQSSWNMEPQLASSMPVYSSDKKSLTVDIDPNAKFSDGSAVLAEDFAYTVQLYMTPAVDSPSYYNFTRWFASNASVYAVDADTVQFNMTEVNPFPLETISFGVIDKSVIQPLISTYGYSIFNQVPGTGDVGWDLVKSAGPFKVDVYDSVNSIAKLVPNTYYANLTEYSAPLLSEWYITFIAGKDTVVAELVAGNIDIVDAQYYPVFDDFTPTGVEGINVTDLVYEEMAINLRHPNLGTGELTPVGTPTAAKNIRKAISHAVPRDYIVSDILGGLGRLGILPISQNCVSLDASIEHYRYNITLAQEYMEAAGYSYAVINEFNNIDIMLISFVGVCSVLLTIKRIKKK